MSSYHPAEIYRYDDRSLVPAKFIRHYLNGVIHCLAHHIQYQLLQEAIDETKEDRHSYCRCSASDCVYGCGCVDELDE